MKLGSKDISKVYLGSKEIDKIYLGSKEIFSSINFADEAILDLQPSSTTGKDTTIYTLNPTYNRGSFAYISSGEYTSVVNKLRGLIQFDLSSIPDNAIITEAFLYLHLNIDYSNNARNVKIYRMKREWVQGTGNDAASGDGATWNTYDGTHNWTSAGGFDSSDCEQTEIGSRLMSDSEPVKKCEVFKLTPTTKAGLDLGYGWMIKADTELDDGYRYDSSNYTTIWLRPALYVSYLLPKQTSYKALRDISNPLFLGRFGSFWYNGANDYVAYYSDGTNILRATSSDGKTWSNGIQVLTPTTGVTDLAQVFKDGNTWYMLYRSTEWGYYATGLATSTDGITFTKYANNPVIAPVEAWEGDAIDLWGIIKVGSTYYGWLNNAGISPRQMGLVTSTDLIHWTRDANNPYFTGYYCAATFKYNNYYYLVAPNSDILANQDSNPLTKRFALFRDTDPKFLPETRQYLGYILNGGGLGAWDGQYLETPCVLTENINKDTFPDNNLRIYYSAFAWYPTISWYGLANGDLSILEKLKQKSEPL